MKYKDWEIIPLRYIDWEWFKQTGHQVYRDPVRYGVLKFGDTYSEPRPYFESIEEAMRYIDAR